MNETGVGAIIAIEKRFHIDRIILWSQARNLKRHFFLSLLFTRMNFYRFTRTKNRLISIGPRN